MNDTEFDRAFIASAFAEAGQLGWRHFGLASAAKLAGLDLARARERFPSRCTVLMRFGRLADQAAVTDILDDATVRERLFDMLMRRIDVLQAHRAGMLALLRALPFDPATAAMLGASSLRSMTWLLDATGTGVGIGNLAPLRAKALLGVWLWTVRAWAKDDSADLGATMAALDKALGQAESAEDWLRGRRRDPGPDPAPEPGPAPTPPVPPDTIPPG